MKSVFVSSTFRDMYFERDILNREISPKLNYLFAKYNQYIRISDLRWGVDTSGMTEQEASERVLSVCMDEIDRCKPFIIVLLGDRYGYVPNESGISVTHMEILRGVLENTENAHVFIYFRKADYAGMPEEVRQTYIEQDMVGKQKLEELKAELLGKMPECCHEYHASWSPEKEALISEDFLQLVYKDLEREFREVFAEAEYKSLLEKQIAENEQILAENIEYAFENTEKLKRDVQVILESEKTYAFLGEAGAGKSMYLSLLCSKLNVMGYKASVVFCGDGPFFALQRNVAEYVLYLLMTSANLEYDFEKYISMEYEDLLTCILDVREHAKEMQFLFVDAVDKCDEGMIHFILWCSRFLQKQLRIVFSSRRTEEIVNTEQSYEINAFRYGKADYTAMTGYMLERYGKSLNQELIELISAKVDTAVCLRLMLHRLLHLNGTDYESINKKGGGIEAINQYLKNLIEQNCTVSVVIENLLHTLLEECDNSHFALLLIGLLACSEHGLSELDLKEIVTITNCNWVQLDYVDFLAKMSVFIRVRENGKIDISHDSIKQNLRVILRKAHKNVFFEMIAVYYLEKEKLSTVDVRNFMSAVYYGEQYRILVAFFQNHKELFSLGTKEEMELAIEIRRSVRRIFLLDEGQFLLKSMSVLRNYGEMIAYQAALSTSFTTVRDYYDKTIVLKMMKLTMCLPLKFFDAQMLEYQLLACEDVFESNHLKQDEEVAGFLEECRQVLANKQSAISGNTKKTTTSNPMEALLDEVKNADVSYDERLLSLQKILKMGRVMAQNKGQAQLVEETFLEILKIEFLNQLGEMEDIIKADIYTTLGLVYKVTKEFEKAIPYEQKSLDIYRMLYEEKATVDFYRKYRERVYNIANVMEAWAMEEATNEKLWRDTCERYEEVYKLDVIAIGQGVSEEELLRCSSSILSFGTALINNGKPEEGFAKYEESIQLILELTKNKPRYDLYVQICIRIMECIYQLSNVHKYEEAQTISAKLNEYLPLIAEGEQTEACLEARKMLGAFSNRINQMIGTLFGAEDLDNALKLSQILCEVYQSAVAVASYEIKANIINTQRNIGDILFLRKKDYERAAEAYECLFDLIYKYNLMGPNEQGRFVDEINLRVADPLIRRIVCLKRLGRGDEAETLIDESTQHLKYLANHTERFKDNVGEVFYRLGMELCKLDAELGISFLMNSIVYLSKEETESEQNRQIIGLILTTIKAMTES